MSENEVANVPTRELTAPPADAPATVQMTHQMMVVATNPDVSVEKMHAMLDLQFRLLDRQEAKERDDKAAKAERAFNRAITKVMMKIEPVRADAENDHTKSKYASMAAVSRAVDPILRDNGMSMSFFPGEAPNENLFRTCMTVRHVEGHSETVHIDLPHDGAGAKGAANKNALQAVGSSFAYGQRYLKRAYLNLAQEDDDAVSATDPYLTADQLQGIYERVKAIATGRKYDFYLKQLAELGGSKEKDIQKVRQSGLRALEMGLAQLDGGAAS